MNNGVIIALRPSCAAYAQAFRPLQNVLSCTTRTGYRLAASRSLIASRPQDLNVQSSIRCFSVYSSRLARPRKQNKSRQETSVQESGRDSSEPEPEVVPPPESLELTWRDYDPDGGFPLPEGDLAPIAIQKIFGSDMDAEMGNWILRLTNYRRQSGSLIEYGIDFSDDKGITKDDASKALEYLRASQPDFDENQAGALWADNQIEQLREEYLERAEGVGIYKKTQEEEERDPVDYRDSVLVTMRKESEARYQEELRMEQEKKEKEDAEALEQARAEGKEGEYLQEKAKRDAQAEAEASKDVAVREPVQKAWLQPVERKSWVKYYEDRATITKETTVPEMSKFERLGPSALLLLVVLGGCYYLHQNYTPPSQSTRILPGVSSTISTIGALTALNIAVAIGYRLPPLWRFFNAYFVIVPGKPAASSILLAMFTHQSFVHMLFNLTLLWTFGRILHEEVGRGTFLAIYLGCGATAGFGSLAWNVLRQNWAGYSFGASTALYGVIAAACLLRPNSNVKAFGYEIPMTGMIILGMFTAFEVASTRIPALATTVDLVGHFGGLISGSVAALLIRRQAGQNLMTRQSPIQTNEEKKDAEKLIV